MRLCSFAPPRFLGVRGPLLVAAPMILLSSLQCVNPSEEDPGTLAGEEITGRPDTSAPGSPATKESAVPQAWTTVQSPTTERLFDIWSMGNVVYIAGANGTILRSDGGAFVQMPTPTSVNLEVIWGANPGQVFAAGGSTVLRLEDGQWVAEAVVTPGPGESASDLWGSSGHDVYLATGGPTGGRIRHSDPGWPTVAQFSSTVSGMQGFAENDIYGLVTDFRFTRLAHFDGGAWTITVVQTEHGVTLSSIWGTAGNDLFLAGFDHDTNMGTVVHYDGATWTQMTVPPNPQTPLRDLWGTSATDVFALASPGKVFHYDGSAWASIEPGIPAADYEAVYGTASGDVYLAGSNGVIVRGTR